jgi:hypothetical protein
VKAIGLADTPAGRAVIAFMDSVSGLGAGMFGFDSDQGPFAAPGCRRLLLRLVEDLARLYAEARSTPTTLVVWLPEYPDYDAESIAVLSRLHAGLVRSLGGVDPPLRLDVEGELAAKIDALAGRPSICSGGTFESRDMAPTSATTKRKSYTR